MDISATGPFTCVNCGQGGFSCLYRVYGSSAKTKKPMTHIKLTECTSCRSMVDDYVEMDNSLLFLDAILQKTRFFRHVLNNCQVTWKLVIKMLVVLILNDCLISWFRVNKDRESMTYVDLEFSFYRLFLKSFLENLTFYAILVGLVSLWNYGVPHHDWRTTTKSVIVCSFVKFFKILNVLWTSDFEVVSDIFLDILFILSLIQSLNVMGQDGGRRWMSAVIPIISFFGSWYLREFWTYISIDLTSFLPSIEFITI